MIDENQASGHRINEGQGKEGSPGSDRIASERMARARENWEADLRRQLGVAGDVKEEFQRLKALADQSQERHDQQRAAQLQSQGDWEQREAEWQERLRKSTEIRQQDRQKFAGKLREQEARIAVSQLEGELQPDGMSLFTRELTAALGVDEQTGEVYPIGEGGRRALRPTGEAMTTADLIEGLKKKYPSLVRVARGGSGTMASRLRPDSEFTRRLAVAEKNPTLEAAAHAFQALLKG